MTENEFETKQTELLKNIPEEFHAAIKNVAWQEGHSYGYEEVLIHLGNLVDALQEPIKNYTNKIFSTKDYTNKIMSSSI